MQLELKRIQREVGITFVFVTHDQEEALTMSDRIAVMSEGRVEQIGTPRGDLPPARPRVFVAGFIGPANLLPGEVIGTDGDDALVRLGAGHTVRADSDGLRQHGSGQHVSVMLRPERLIATAEPNDAGRSLSGTLADVVFQGPTARVIVHLADGSDVIATVPSGVDLPFLRPGSPVHLTWEPGSAYLLDGWPRRPGATASDLESLDAQADS